MLLTGTFHRNLDEKLRFSLPKPIRNLLAAEDVSTMFLAPGTDGSLTLYTAAAFEELARQLNQSSPAAQDVRTFSRLFYAQAQPVELDGQGRIRIPNELAQLAQVEKEIVLLGVRDHLEIWGRAVWEDYLAQRQPRYDEFAERAFSQTFVPPAAAAQAAAQPATPQPPAQAAPAISPTPQSAAEAQTAEAQTAETAEEEADGPPRRPR